jgi:hypothetical protein
MIQSLPQYPNRICIISLSCLTFSGVTPTLPNKYLAISSYEYYSVTSNTPNFTPLNLPDLVFQQGQTPNYLMQSTTMYAFNTSNLICNSFTLI